MVHAHNILNNERKKLRDITDRFRIASYVVPPADVYPPPLLMSTADIDLLYPPAISGKSPTARSGHSAAIIGTDLVVFGGVRGR